MATNCIIDDYVSRKRSSVLLTEDQFAKVLKLWDQEDQLLKDLHVIERFKGRETWSALDPWHFRVLLTNSFNNVDRYVEPADRFDWSNPFVGSLYFMVMALIICLEKRTDGTVDTIRIMRISELEVTMEFTLTMIPEQRKPLPSTSLTVVVDNTKQ